ncbi:type IVB secretion system protein IcmV [Legionella sp. W05-934-2]|jgi:intracellular multiplication protein IcmV|uniref:type IVB secretion system protein IcmV n=1 Tax=Legionella sp. W05-934-2 TaxID=1198649 RepID=UPI0034623385
MQKRKQSRIRSIFGRVFNFRYWVDYDRLKGYSLYLWNGFKRFFVPQNQQGAGSQMQFDKAIKEMNLSEADLKSREVALIRMSRLMAILAGFIFLYSFYHLFYGSLQAAFLCYSVTLIAVALAFRYHFWYFQIKERKLGCSFSQWFREGLLGQKS